MITKTLKPALLLAVLGMLSLTPEVSTPALAYDCAHGPDTYRVRNVAHWDMLNMRAGPSARAPIVGRIPPQGSGVHCLGPCNGNWCRVSWRGVVGWTNMRYLGE